MLLIVPKIVTLGSALKYYICFSLLMLPSLISAGCSAKGHKRSQASELHKAWLLSLWLLSIHGDRILGCVSPPHAQNGSITLHCCCAEGRREQLVLLDACTELMFVPHNQRHDQVKLQQRCLASVPWEALTARLKASVASQTSSLGV